ncbi:hypothetical protein BDU57DRAFT_517235 [Ampelomyces quisqualis]|uniref:Uncharacterized protein n=1 Tax=Ampelomyces quisqualis TaxID=50730 RepID=A0A6A5QQ99_AMPQU|nr:hypothetical protein BDU57DRAFT_517235 [Ampelomyces quisqualis]
MCAEMEQRRKVETRKSARSASVHCRLRPTTSCSIQFVKQIVALCNTRCTMRSFGTSKRTQDCRGCGADQVDGMRGGLLAWHRHKPELHLAGAGARSSPFTAAGLAYIRWSTKQILGPISRWVTFACIIMSTVGPAVVTSHMHHCFLPLSHLEHQNT